MTSTTTISDPGQHVANQATYSNDPRMQRSSHWPHVRDAFLAHWLELKRAAIQGFDEIWKDFAWEVHHEIPFHLGVLLGRGYIELDTRNLIVAPRGPIDLHLVVCHLDDFKSFNPDVAHDLKTWGGALYGGIGDMTPIVEVQASPIWQRKHLHRPKPWDQMTEFDKKAVTHLIDTRLPIKAVAA